ncbi:hypothetical protein AM233_01680 [Bacillus sp. FJAT-22058]|nr:hypothetical protein AM233_01680 [Bacillus sp. FJAT-22058]
MGQIKRILSFKTQVDWNGRRETPAGKASPGRPHRRKSAEGGPPAESECLEWRSNFTLTQKNCRQKEFYLSKHKLIGTEGARLLREKRVQGDPTGVKAPRADRPRKASAWSGDLILH